MAEQSKKDRDAQSVDWRKLRLWQIQPIRDALVILGIVGLVYLGYVCRVVTVPMLLALMLAYLFEPLVAWLTARFKWLSRQGAAVGIIVLAGTLIVVPLAIGLGFAVVQGAGLVGTAARNTGLLVASVQAPTAQERAAARGELPRTLRDVGQWLVELRTEVEAYQRRREPGVEWREEAEPSPPDGTPAPASEVVPAEAAEPVVIGEPAPEVPAWKEQLYHAIDIGIRWLQGNAETLAQNIGRQALGTGAQAFSAVVGAMHRLAYVIFVGFLTAFFFYFFCTGYGAVLDFWEGLIPEKKKGRVIDLVHQMDRVVAGFVRGRITICVLLAVYMTIAYWLIGVPTPLILGPIVGLLFIVPFVHVLGIPVAILLMVLEPSSLEWQQQWWWIVFAPVGVYLGGQLLDDYVLSPTIQGKATGMDTPTILFASIAGGALAGIYGLLLAIPVAACIKILLKEVFWPRFRAWGKGTERDFLPISREG